VKSRKLSNLECASTGKEPCDRPLESWKFGGAFKAAPKFSCADALFALLFSKVSFATRVGQHILWRSTRSFQEPVFLSGQAGPPLAAAFK